ncbi:hypothetical protein NPIL_650951, partial [Nephila pilipes]
RQLGSTTPRLSRRSVPFSTVAKSKWKAMVVG